jgi:hypothetical protein
VNTGAARLGKSELGQSEKNTVRVYVFRFALKTRTSLDAAGTSLLCQFRTLVKLRGDYSITSSAVTSRDDGRVNPRALAALRLITCLRRVGCSTGKSAGFAPRNILSA